MLELQNEIGLQNGESEVRETSPSNSELRYGTQISKQQEEQQVETFGNIRPVFARADGTCARGDQGVSQLRGCGE